MRRAKAAQPGQGLPTVGPEEIFCFAMNGRPVADFGECRPLSFLQRATAGFGLAPLVVGTGDIDPVPALPFRGGYCRWADGLGVFDSPAARVTRFKNAGQLCSWAGLTPRHRESDTKVTRGHVTKQGSRLLRWALIEAIQRVPRDSVIGSVKDAIIARRGKQARNIAKVAAAPGGRAPPGP